MKKRDFVSIVCAAAVMAGALSGCGGTAQKSDRVTDDDFSAPITIRVLDNSTELTSSDDFTNEKSKFFDERWKLICDKFNVRFEYVPVSYSSWADQVRTLLSTNSLPDVAIGALMPAEYQHYAKQGIITTLTKDDLALFPNIMKNINAVTAHDAFISPDGNYIAIPRALDIEGLSTDYTYQFVYRKDWAKEAGVELKEAYTLEEIYDMFAKVQKLHPEALMYNSITPNNVLQLGMYQYVDQFADTPKGNFRLNSTGTSYEFLAAQPEALEGLKWIKRFYGAGFIHPEYTTLPMYEARTEFNTGRNFSYWDGSDLLFFSKTIKEGFEDQNPDLNFDDCVDIGLLKNSQGKYMIKDVGNYWSEIFFNASISGEMLTRFLHVYDYLCSEEGMYMQSFGIKDKHYRLERDGTVTNIRPADEQTGLPEQFNLKVPDTYMMVYHGPLPGTTLYSKDSSLSEYCRRRIVELFSLREKSPHTVTPYDAKVFSYDSRDFSAFTGNPFKELNLLISTTSSESELVNGWNRFVSEHKTEYENIVKELNRELLDT